MLILDGVVRHLDVCLESPSRGFHPVERPNTRQAAGAQLRRRSTVTECWGQQVPACCYAQPGGGKVTTKICEAQYCSIYIHRDIDLSKLFRGCVLFIWVQSVCI